MRGRLQGIFIVVVAGGPRIADVAHGATAAVVGTAVAAAGGGVLVVVLTVAAVLAVPVFWRYRLARPAGRRRVRPGEPQGRAKDQTGRTTMSWPVSPDSASSGLNTSSM